MKKIIRKKDVKNITDLLHSWGHGLEFATDYFKIGNWTVENNKELYYKSLLVAKHIDTDKEKITIILKNFQSGGAFDNGRSSYFIAQTVYNRICYQYTDISIFKKVDNLNNLIVDDSNIDNIVDWYITEFRDHNKRYLANPSAIKEFVSNNRRTNSYFNLDFKGLDHIVFYNIELPKILKKNFKAALSDNLKSVKFNEYYKHYTGWGSFNYKCFKSIEFYLNLNHKTPKLKLNKFLTKNEIVELYFKLWRNNALKNDETNKFQYSLTESRRIYNSPDRKAFEDKVTESENTHKRIKLLKTIKIKIKSRLEILFKNDTFIYIDPDIIEKYINDNNITNNNVFRKVNLSNTLQLLPDGKTVKTDLRVLISVDEALKTYKLFKSFKQGNTINETCEKYNINSILYGDITTINYIKIKKRVELKSIDSKYQRYIRIGCHMISEDEADRFINEEVKNYEKVSN